MKGTAVSLTSLILGCGVGTFAFAQIAAAQSAQLQIQNACGHAVDVFWLKDAIERVPNGSIDPGSEILVETTVGHRFALVPRNDPSETFVTCKVTVQSFRLEPAGDGVPTFYTQRVSWR